MINRENYINSIIPFVDTELIKVITGVRRSGKSVMLKLIQDYLISKGVKPEQILSLNFEEIRHESLLEYHRLNEYLETFIVNSSLKSYIFMDEIQEVKSFEKVINSIRATFEGRVDIYITGSNAKLLSGELASLIGGRYIQFQIFPFKFSEYVAAKSSLGISASSEEYFQSFVLEGGMPFQIFNHLSFNDRVNYLNDLYSSIILKDIIQREQIREIDLLKRLLSYIFANTGRTFSASSINKYLKSEGINASTTTILNFLRFAENAYAIIALKRYDIQGKKILSTQEKYYVIDHGLRQALYGRNTNDIELILENIVLLELIARGYEVFVGKTHHLEIDFIAQKVEKHGFEKKYIQVSYLLASEETKEREFRSLRDINDNFEKIILSLDRFTSSSDGIIHRNIIDWLLMSD